MIPTPSPTTRAAVPWEQQPRETARAFAAFTVYRDLPVGERSIDAAYQQHTGRRLGEGKRAPGVWTNWSTLHQWVNRAAAWDAEADRQKRQAALAAEVEEVRGMRRRHVQASMQLQKKALERLKGIKLEEISAFALVRMLAEATKIERTARGEPETITETRQVDGSAEGGPAYLDPRQMTDEELAAAELLALAAERQRLAAVARDVAELGEDGEE